MRTEVEEDRVFPGIRLNSQVSNLKSSRQKIAFPLKKGYPVTYNITVLNLRLGYDYVRENVTAAKILLELRLFKIRMLVLPGY